MNDDDSIRSLREAIGQSFTEGMTDVVRMSKAIGISRIILQSDLPVEQKNELLKYLEEKRSEARAAERAAEEAARAARFDLNVADLIAKLELMPKDAPVYVEGCDCIGEARDVRLTSAGDVLIER